ncbi:unnamed protein product [Effrenium voratum]|nr:unnamed protein product [Effrenium voratum]
MRYDIIFRRPLRLPPAVEGTLWTGFWCSVHSEQLDLREAEDLLRGGRARGLEFWENATTRSAYYHDPPVWKLQSIRKRMGYQHLATTTRYGDTCCASCGSVNTAELVQGTGFYAVASAESMQDGGIGDGHYCTHDANGHRGTTGMGCLSCAKGKFLPAHPFSYPLWAQPHEHIFSEEIYVVVADTCPHAGNEAWCPGHEGHANKFGVKHHFDFTDPPAKYDNYYFVWSRIDCPARIRSRYHRLSRC